MRKPKTPRPATPALIPELELDAGTATAPLLALFDEYVAARRAAGATRRADRPWRPSTEALYRRHWTAFAQWCTAYRLTLATLTPTDLESYLALRAVRRVGDWKELNARHEYRLLELVDRLTRFDAARRGSEANSAARELIQRDYRQVNQRDRDTLPRFLMKGERKTLVAMLSLPYGSSAANAPRSWIELRDFAAVAVQLGAGLTPGEVRQLGRDDVMRDSSGRPWKMSVAASGNSPRREALLAIWAARVLADWLKVRATLRLGSDWVFLTETGTQWSKNKCDQASDGVLLRAGVSTEHGHFRLRHTFALIELRDNKRNYEDVAKALGVLDTVTWRRRYERVIDNFRKVG